ncbi:dihydropteroate synthase [Zavarzinella formosa]|uniref:dihydropteroate synthase n=1 Tax=Zavarzinella formosa TaxID=360055 RepID=UPI0002DEB9E1|nr:dihydropteroate synthase [Zavarzinella formosa]
MRGWNIRGGSITIGSRPLVMGIVNTTPDSFSDGGKFDTADLAVAHAERLLDEGADILDVGGESSRPGAEGVSAAEELARVLPVVQKLAGRSGVVISVDTTKAVVAKACLEAGAAIINDISGAAFDGDMPATVRQFQAGLVIMHMQGTPRTMQQNPVYADVVGEVRDWLGDRLHQLLDAGLELSQIAVDPGIGFGKTTAHNLRLIRNLGTFSTLGCPVLLGVSRKRFIGEITGKPVDDRLAGSLAVACQAALTNSAHIIRVHDVGPTVGALKMLDAIANAVPAVE